VLYEYFFQTQPSFSSRNANPSCQSQRIKSNTSAPRASSPNSNNQQDVLPSSLCVVSILFPVTTVLLIATPSCQSQCIGSNTSAPKASSLNSSNEYDVLHYSLCVLSMLHCPVTRTFPVIVECKSIVSIASHGQQHEHSTAPTNIMRCPRSLGVV
jgi:hypothetical protein